MVEIVWLCYDQLLNFLLCLILILNRKISVISIVTVCPIKFQMITFQRIERNSQRFSQSH